MKRIGDFSIAFILIAFTLPLMSIVALAIKLSSPGPIFSREERPRLGGRHVRILKLRTTVH
jgi:putative colanic acid biosysnthesis UDP-glucose lipid carrier transferase